MWSEVQAKRNKFAKEIRLKQHQQYFQLHRQSHMAELPAIAYLPILLQNQLYSDIEILLDHIEVPTSSSQHCQQEQPSQQLLKTVRDRYQHHCDQETKMTLFKLLNRLNKWTEEDLEEALKLLKEDGRHEIVKELAIYVEGLCGNGEGEEGGKAGKGKEVLERVFGEIVGVRVNDQGYRLFWLDLICRAIQLLPQSIPKFTQTPTLLSSIDTPLTPPIDDFTQIRLFRILSKLSSVQSLHLQLLSLQCFPLVLNQIREGSIEVVIEGLEVIAEMLGGEDAVVGKLVGEFGVLAVLGRYREHVMVGVQARVYWGISNVAGSECYRAVLQDQDIMASIFKKSKLQSRPQIRIQAYCCLLNLLCNSTQPQLHTLFKNPNTPQLLLQTLHESSQAPLRPLLLQRSLYSTYHILATHPQAYPVLDQLGLKKVLNALYVEEKEEGKVKMLAQLLDCVEKIGKDEGKDL